MHAAVRVPAIILFGAAFIIAVYLATALIAQSRAGLRLLPRRGPRVCPRCGCPGPKLTPVGVFWRLQWFYPLVFLPAFLIGFALSGGGSARFPSAVGWYLYATYGVLGIARLLGVTQSIIGGPAYECPTCGVRFSPTNGTKDHLGNDGTTKTTSSENSEAAYEADLASRAAAEPDLLYLFNSYQAHRVGALVHLPTEPERTAKGNSLKACVETWRKVLGESFHLTAREYPPLNGEFLVAASDERVILTNRRLFLLNPTVPGKVARAVSLAEVAGYRCRGRRTTSVQLQLASGEVIALHGLRTAPGRACIEALAKKARQMGDPSMSRS